MDGFRWFLFLVGLLVIAGVYLYTRRERVRADEKAAKAKANPERVEPSMGGEFADDASVEESLPQEPMLVTPEPQVDEQPIEPAVEPEEAPKQKIVTLRVVARNQGAFAGDELALSLRGIGMRHGQMGIFHRFDGNDEDKIIFSAASLVEPGSFDLKNLKQQQIPGISLFMILPGPVEGAQAFDLMMVAARALSQSLNAELLDETGSTLSIQRERYLREEIVQYETSNLVA